MSAFTKDGALIARGDRLYCVSVATATVTVIQVEKVSGEIIYDTTGRSCLTDWLFIGEAAAKRYARERAEISVRAHSQALAEWVERLERLGGSQLTVTAQGYKP